jgi:hypothetical protein
MRGLVSSRASANRDIQCALEEQGGAGRGLAMEGDDGDFPNVIDLGIGPGSRRQVRDGANIEMVAEGNLGSLARLGGLAGESDNDFIDELGAGQPVEIGDPTQHYRGKREFVVDETADFGAVRRITAQGLRDQVRGWTGSDDENLARFGLKASAVPQKLRRFAPRGQSGCVRVR